MPTHPTARLILCLATLYPFAAQAAEHWYSHDHLYFHAGTYVHFNSDEDYDGERIFAGLEAIKSNGRLYGLNLFNNSFNQFSQYLYGGKSWDLPGKVEGFQIKITAGLIHGYTGRFKDKIPFNDLGIAPAIIPSIGYRKGRFGAEAFVFGFSGLLFTAGMEF